MSDIETDDIERFQSEKDKDLAMKAGLVSQGSFDPIDSDEEVMSLGADHSESSAESEGFGQETFYDDKADKIQHNEGGWGPSKASYYGGEDDVGADSEASVEEEEEALRLQRKHYERMAEEDFVDEDDMESWTKDASSKELPQEEGERLPEQDPAAMTVEERNTYLETSNPEVALLTSELELGKRELESLEEEDSALGYVELKKVALRCYLGMLYTYFAIFTSESISRKENIKEHPVMEGILKARELWNAAKQLHEPEGSGSRGLETDERLSMPSPPSSEAPSDAEVWAESEPESESGESSQETQEAQDDSEDEFSVKVPQPKSNTISVHNDFDETADTIEQQARQKNKQSLRFYTSQVGKRSRDVSRNEKFAGDIDIPYREREFERRRRLLEEARQRGQKERDSIDDESNDDDTNDRNHENSLYSEVQRNRSEASRRKQQRHLEAVEAAKQGRINEYLAQHPNVDKRAIDYQIRKNKGLTPKRKKENRNARVKKRVRYSQAQKKLGGVKPRVRESAGPYGGELTGIRKNLTHSRKFTS